MKNLFGIIAGLLLTVMIGDISGQKIVEVPNQEFSNAYLKEIKKVNEITVKNPKKAIRLLENLLKKDIKPYEMYDIIYERLPYLYAGQKEYQKCLNLWTKAQENGYFYPLKTGNEPFFEFINEITNKEQLQKVLIKNDQLKEKYGSTGNVEYFVKTPINYSKEKKYSVIMVIHGGWGSHIASMENWNSAIMRSEYITVYIQGSIIRSTYLRTFDFKNYLKQIQSVYTQFKQKYSVDTAKIILAGQSAGGMMSVQLVINNLIPVKGLLLAFPVKPRDLDSNKVKEMAGRGVRAAIIAGENDWALKEQKEMGVIFDKYGLKHRFLVFPEIGHEFAPEFEKHINRSLEFIWKKK